MRIEGTDYFASSVLKTLPTPADQNNLICSSLLYRSHFVSLPLSLSLSLSFIFSFHLLLQHQSPATDVICLVKDSVSIVQMAAIIFCHYFPSPNTTTSNILTTPVKPTTRFRFPNLVNYSSVRRLTRCSSQNPPQSRIHNEQVPLFCFWVFSIFVKFKLFINFLVLGLLHFVKFKLLTNLLVLGPL